MRKKYRKGFTLVEVLTVVSVTACLAAIMLPALSRARQVARVAVVNAELRQIALGLDMYMDDNNDKPPPTRTNCSMGWEDHQLPPELAAGGYLPEPDEGTGMTAGIKDRYNTENTYKYWSAVEQYQNNRFIPSRKAFLYIPESFPDEPEGTPETDIRYDSLSASPVSWIIYSQGPEFDRFEMTKELNGPVAKRCWYKPDENKGIITRLRLRDGRHTGSYRD